MGETFVVARRICAATALGLAYVLSAATAQARSTDGDFPDLPLPPMIEGLVGLPTSYAKGRGAYLGMITEEAIRQGLPPAIADAVTQIETAYNPNAIGGIGEVGLMQVRPQTAAMLGYRGPDANLAEPMTNVRYGVAYLARAWRLAEGDLCRALMKYRAGHGEERMTPLSVEYCRRARAHLASIGSPLAGGASPPPPELATTSATSLATNVQKPSLPTSTQSALTLQPRPSDGAKSSRPDVGTATNARSQPTARRAASAKIVSPLLRPRTVKVATASKGADVLTAVQTALRMKKQERTRRIWAERDARMNAITAKLKRSGLIIAAGI